SGTVFVSVGSKLVAPVENPTSWPSSLTEGYSLSPSASSPSGPTLTRSVVESRRLGTKTSLLALPSFWTRSWLVLVKKTSTPSAVQRPSWQSARGGVPSQPRLTISVVSSCRSRMNIWVSSYHVSTRPVELLSKTA